MSWRRTARTTLTLFSHCPTSRHLVSSPAPNEHTVTLVSASSLDSPRSLLAPFPTHHALECASS